jgi:hypothetical protein
MTPLPPWANGPFELLLHAEEHLQAGDDFDRRIALISFDNSIEITIAAYLSLHPLFRGNRTYKNEDVSKWLGNYHRKLDFLSQEIAIRQASWLVDKNHILYCHDQRNEQYHAGHKGVPEKQILDIIRKAALWVFSLLFEAADIEERLARAVTEKRPASLQKRDSDYDNAIDQAFETVTVAGQIYSVSEVLFSVDYEAYKELANQLLEDQRNSDASLEPPMIAESLH